jgi:hypothetical protein
VSKAKEKKVTWPVHKMGKQCGYEEFEDGSIRIAPRHADTLQQALDKQAAMDEFLASITRVSQTMAAEVNQLKRRFWKNVREDYGLAESEDWSCTPSTRMLTRRPKDKP